MKTVLTILVIASIIAMAILVLIHLKKLISNVSASLKDPITGIWSPKLLTAFTFVLLTVVLELGWLKKAYIADVWTGMELILGFNFAYITASFGMRMAEKMQAKKIDKATNAGGENNGGSEQK